MNPHFLYNTLNSIYLMAERISAKKTSRKWSCRCLTCLS
ncbi:histidine kinase [Paenibacillus rhizoplanae]